MSCGISSRRVLPAERSTTSRYSLSGRFTPPLYRQRPQGVPPSREPSLASWTARGLLAPRQGSLGATARRAVLESPHLPFRLPPSLALRPKQTSAPHGPCRFPGDLLIGRTKGCRSSLGCPLRARRLSRPVYRRRDARPQLRAGHRETRPDRLSGYCDAGAIRREAFSAESTYGEALDVGAGDVGGRRTSVAAMQGERAILVRNVVARTDEASLERS